MRRAAKAVELLETTGHRMLRYYGWARDHDEFRALALQVEDCTAVFTVVTVRPCTLFPPHRPLAGRRFRKYPPERPPLSLHQVFQSGSRERECQQDSSTD